MSSSKANLMGRCAVDPIAFGSISIVWLLPTTRNRRLLFNRLQHCPKCQVRSRVEREKWRPERSNKKTPIGAVLGRISHPIKTSAPRGKSIDRILSSACDITVGKCVCFSFHFFHSISHPCPSILQATVSVLSSTQLFRRRHRKAIVR